jgi:hypothetical protein
LINNQNPACSGNGYQDYTNTIVPLEPEQQYTIKIKCGYASQTVGGWFDLNGNNVFDGNEKLISMSGSTTETSQTFTIPADFTPGTSRFRLVCKWNGTPTSCDNGSYGQTHDYTIVLPELYPRVQNVVAVLGEASITVTWDAPEGEIPNGYNVYRNGGKLNTDLLTTTTFTEEGITEGVYVYHIKAVYAGNKESFAEMSNVICNFTPCIAPLELSAVVEDNTAILTWEDSEEMAGTLLGYNIFRNEIQINEELVAEKEYIDEDLPAGTYHYQVGAVYEHCESGLTNEAVVTILSCEIPTNLDGIADKSTAIITWNELEEFEGELLGYNIYRDGDETPLNGELPIEKAEYRDEDLPNGKYLYQVAAVYEHCESERTEGIIVEIDVTGINDIQTDSCQIFPNPTNGQLIIDNGQLTIDNVEIFDILGKLVFIVETPLMASLQFDISYLPSGTYFIRIQTENSVVTKKVVKN